MRRQWRTLTVILVLVTLAGLVLGFKTINIGNFERGSSETILGLKFGLDLQGGIDLVYSAALKDPVTGEPVLPTADQMESVKRTIERRVNASGLGEPNIQLLGEDRLLIQLPGVADSARAKKLIGETARLEWKHRTLNVSRPIQGLGPEDILGVQLTSLNLALPEEGAVEEPAGQVTTTPATTTEAAAEGQVEETLIPVLLIEFTDQGAQVFQEVVDRLRDSLLPVAGSGRVFPNYLNISVEGESSPPPQISYSPVGVLPTGQTIPLLGEPWIRQLKDGNTFMVELSGFFPDMASAEERYGGQPKITLSEFWSKVDEDVGLSGEDLARAYPSQHQQSGLPIIVVEFSTDGTRKFAELTTELAGTPDLLAIFLDRQELLAPSVVEPILGGSTIIQGTFTFEFVRDTALLLESGRLPIPIELIQERTVDAILGADSLSKSVVAGLAGLGLVLLFMVVYYRAPGVVASVSLLIYASIVLAVFKIVPVTLTLSGVAAAILSIGMAVDANILIFERMKEELRAGRTMLSAINIGFNRAWPAIRDSNVSTLITCGILFWFADTLGATVVQGFAITLAIGVGLSMFSAITVSRTLLRLLAVTPLAKRLELFVPSGAADLPQQQTGA